MDPATLPKVRIEDVPWRRIGALFAPHRDRLVMVFALSLVAAGFGLLPPLAIKRVIDVALPKGDARLLVVLTAVLAGAPVCAGLLGVAHDRLNHQVGQSVMRDLRHALFQAVQRQPVSFFTRTQAGELVQRLTGDVHFVQGVVTGAVVDAAIQLVTLAATAAILFVLDWRLALACVVLVPLCALPVRAATQALRRIRRDTQQARSALAALTTEAFGVSGALLTRIFAREDHVEGEFAVENQRVMDLELRFNVLGRALRMVTSILGPAGTAVLFLYGGLRVIQGDMTVGAVFAFAAYLGQLLGPAARLLNVHVEVSAAAAVFQRLFEVLDLEPALVEAPGAVPLPPLEGRIALRSVSFSYDAGRRALHEVSFDVTPGSVVALVGPSGAGKSTLSSLLARLADPEEGVVEIDGIDLRTVTLPRSGGRSRSSRRTRSCSTRRSRRTCASPSSTRRRRRCSRRVAGPGSTRSWPPCRSGSRPWSGSAGTASRAANGSASPSRARCSPTPASWCSTRRRRTSTRPRRPRSARRSPS